MKYLSVSLLFLMILMVSGFGVAQEVSIDGISLPGKVVRKLQAPTEYELYVVGEKEVMNASMGPMHGPLYIKPPKGPARQIAEDVVLSRPGAKGLTYFVNRDFNLFVTDKKGEVRKIADHVYGDFSFNRDYSRVLVTRPQSDNIDETMTVIELLDSNGVSLRRLVDVGNHSMPMFSPDGKKILYASGDTGIISWYLVNVDGSQNHQLTNIGMESGRMTDDFVPVMSTYDGSGFIDDTHFRYLDGTDGWILDISTGKAVKELKR